jgi:hypothetical protein
MPAAGFNPDRLGCRIPEASGGAVDDGCLMRELQLYFRMDRRQIAHFRFLLEAYDGLAMLRTLDPAAGRVVLYLSESCREELDDLIRGLAGEIRLEPADPETDDTGPCDARP